MFTVVDVMNQAVIKRGRVETFFLSHCKAASLYGRHNVGKLLINRHHNVAGYIQTSANAFDHPKMYRSTGRHGGGGGGGIACAMCEGCAR